MWTIHSLMLPYTDKNPSSQLQIWNIKKSTTIRAVIGIVSSLIYWNWDRREEVRPYYTSLHIACVYNIGDAFHSCNKALNNHSCNMFLIHTLIETCILNSICIYNHFLSWCDFFLLRLILFTLSAFWKLFVHVMPVTVLMCKHQGQQWK